MNDTTPQVGYALDKALELAALGYKVVPIPAGLKYPKGIPSWQRAATNNEAQIRQWFTKTTHGVGWAMGRQPNGKFVFAIDVEEAGMERLIELLREHGQEPFFNTACQQTGGSGMHFIFECDIEITNSAHQFDEHIDIRGEGGQILVGPTIHPNGNPYVWTKFPNERRPLPAPDWVIERITAGVAGAGLEPTSPSVEGGEPGFAQPASGSDPESPADHESPPVMDGARTPERTVRSAGLSSSDDSPADWVRANLGIGDMLTGAGWTYMEHRGEDSYWCRPGKNPRDGHSAILHGDAPLVVWSTEVAWRSGSDNRDGSLSFSPIQVYAEVNFGGDVAEAAKQVRKNHMPQSSPSPSISAGGIETGGDGETGVDIPLDVSLNLPPEFWESRPVLAQIRQAADCRLVSPDALLMSVLARFAALIPASTQIPGIIGGNATFDFIGCVVASSSGGKTVANSVAAELLPNRREDILMDASPGSGEGLVSAFMGWDKDEKGKKIGDPSWKFGKYKAIHFNVDEGSGLMEQQSRAGTTIVQTMCSAWSGAGLGQLNASIDTRRYVPAKKRRVSAVLNIQTGFGHQLLGEQMRHVGLPQRIAFAWAHAQVPDAESEWPGALDVKVPASSAVVTTIDYDDEIVAEIVATRRAVLSGRVELGELDGHANLVRLKISGMLALLDGRRIVDPTDWELSSHIMRASAAVRDRLLAVKREADEKAVVTQGTRQATRELAAEDAKERQKIARLADRIEAVIGEEEWTWSKLRKKITSGESRHRFEAAVLMAQDRWAVEIVDIEGTGEAGRLIRKG